MPIETVTISPGGRRNWLSEVIETVTTVADERPFKELPSDLQTKRSNGRKPDSGFPST
jgi:hypothetical protein